jgi:urease accessory protein
VAGPAAAAVRLLSLDPFGTHRILAGLAPTLNELAAGAAIAAAGPARDLPSCAAPLLDIAAEQHAGRTSRLFAS